MRKLFIIISCLALFRGLAAQEEQAAAWAPAAADSSYALQFHQFRLPNGLQVLLLENHQLPRLFVQLYVDVPLHEEVPAPGTAYLAGELLRMGTEQRGKQEIDAALHLSGASLQTEATGAQGSMSTQLKEKLLDLLADVTLRPAFPPEALAKAKTALLAKLKSEKEDPLTLAERVGRVLRNGDDYPYGLPMTEAGIKKITVEDCRAYHQRYFVPNLSYLVLVGDVDAVGARQLAERYFGSWKSTDLDKHDFTKPERPENTQVEYVTTKLPTMTVAQLTYPLKLRTATDDALRAEVLNNLLEPGSPLRTRLLRGAGTTYSDGLEIRFLADRHIGHFSAGGPVSGPVLDTTLRELLKVLSVLRSSPVRPDELEAAKQQAIDDFAEQLTDPLAVARLAINSAVYKLPADYYATYPDKIKQISGAELLALARQYISPAQAYLLVVGDQVWAEKLTTFAADSLVHYRDSDGRRLEALQAAGGVADISSGEKVVADYLTAIGGADKLRTVKDQTLEMKANLQGMQLKMLTQRKPPAKLFIAVTMNGTTINETRLDGEVAKVTVMGEEQAVDAAARQRMQLQTRIFPELDYPQLGYRLALQGEDELDGRAVYVVDIIAPNGSVAATEYFDAETKLKVRSILTQDGATLTTDFADYRQVNGILFPYTITSQGVAPQPLTFQVVNVEFNEGVSDGVFEIK